MPIDRIVVVNAALADLGNLVRRVQAGSLDQDAFYTLTGSLRRNLKTLRLELNQDELPVPLRDLGASIGQLLNSGDLKRGTALLDDGPNRARTYGHLAVIDGALTTEPLENKGA